MRRKYPPLTPDEVIRILKARGFAYHHTTGSHEYYLGTIRGATRRVTVDGHYREFSDKLIILTRTSRNQKGDNLAHKILAQKTGISWVRP